MFSYLLSRFQRLKNDYDDTLVKLRNQKVLIYIILELFEGIIDIIITIYLIDQTYLGSLLIGNFILYSNSMNGLKQSILQLLEKIAELYKNSAMVNQIKQFYQLENENKNKSGVHIDKIYSIVMKNVCYRYKDEKYVLKNINLLDEPLGYQFQDGRQLSIGQWQKLAFLRALFAPSSLMVLDEPNAALDINSENNLFTLYEKRRNDKISVLIMHRFHKVILDSDKIIVLKDGEIEVQGKHKELLQQEGYYQEFYYSHK